MVGVPALTKWVSGPSSRIGWPFFWVRRSASISGLPNRKAKISAVKKAPPARKVI